MRRLIRFVEQLQLAGAFLHEKGQQHARLSLILCDNVVELLAHERCEFYLLREASWLTATKLTKNELADARGQNFAPKLNLLVRLEDARPDERDFAAQAHTLRNECYHTAAMHQEIAWRVAWEYHELACTLFDRFRQSGYILGGTNLCSEATKRLMESAGFAEYGRVAFDDSLVNLTAALRSTKPAAQDSLSNVLSASAKRRFSELSDAIDFIAHDGLNTDSQDEAIKAAYFQATLDTEALSSGLDTQDSEAFREFHRRREEANAKYICPLRFEHVTRWVNLANVLVAETSPTRALVRYMDLRRDSEEACTILHEMARGLDEEIQLQIDIARGK